jgi:hypothetical protein
LRRRLRLHDRRVLRGTAAVGIGISAIAILVLAHFALTLLAPRPRPIPAQAIAADGCSPAQIQSFDSWQLLRIDRPAVVAPQKRLWERSFSDPLATRRALRDRLNGWPSFLVADKMALPDSRAEFARRLARDTWRGLDALTDRASGLPLDTVTFGGRSADVADARIGDYTNVTNVGLHLAATVAAQELGLLTEDEARGRLVRTLQTLESLETDDGFFFNYYDTTSLERTSHFVSFVDSAWLTAGLMVVRMTYPELYERCTALIEQTDYERLYDSSAELMSHGYYVEPRAQSRYHYGVLYTEARLGVLIAIGKGDVPENVWFNMIRTFPADCEWQSLVPIDVHTKTVRGYEVSGGYYEWRGLRYVPSWGGSMFEALMPTVVLDELAAAPRSLGPNGRAHAVGQRRHALRELDLPVWGFSPSATPGAEQYGEFGVRMLGSHGYAPGPVTPHASALALAVIPKAALANLHELAKRYDVYGDFGFYDAVDPRTGTVAYKYLALDQSMLFLALANYLTDHSVQRRFAADPIAQRALPVIGEEDFFD